MTLGQIKDRVEFALAKRADLLDPQVEQSILIAINKIIRMYPWEEVIRSDLVVNYDLSEAVDLRAWFPDAFLSTYKKPSRIGYLTSVAHRAYTDNAWEQLTAITHQIFYSSSISGTSGILYWYDVYEDKIRFRRPEQLILDEYRRDVQVSYATTMRIPSDWNDDGFPILNGKDDAIIAYAVSDLYRLYNELESASRWKSEGDRIIGLETRSDTFGVEGRRANPIGFFRRNRQVSHPYHRDPFRG